jgi:hypothetical protein
LSLSLDGSLASAVGEDQPNARSSRRAPGSAAGVATASLDSAVAVVVVGAEYASLAKLNGASTVDAAQRLAVGLVSRGLFSPATLRDTGEM